MNSAHAPGLQSRGPGPPWAPARMPTGGLTEPGVGPPVRGPSRGYCTSRWASEANSPRGASFRYSWARVDARAVSRRASAMKRA